MRSRQRIAESLGEALIVALGGFLLMNVAFILYFLFVTALDKLLLVGDGPGSAWFRALEMGAFVGLLGLGTLLVVRSNLPEVLKATWCTVPLAAVYAVLGATLWRWGWLPVAAGAAVFLTVAALLHRWRSGWMYWWALGFVSFAMLMITLTGTDI